MTRATVLITAAIALGVTTGPQAQTRGGPAQPVADALRASWDAAKKNIRESGDVMPEAKYTYQPTKEVRTFGQIIAHVAGANYVFCSAVKGEKSPQAENAFEGLATKGAILKAWDESVKYCDGAFASITDRSAGEPIEMPFGQGKGARIKALFDNVGHLNEHYGNLVTYFRINGIVPPSSRK